MKKIIKIISIGLCIFIFLSLSACNNGSSIISLFCKHEEVIDPAIDSTCLYEGKTEGKHCSKCNKVLVEQITIEKLEHQEKVRPAKEPTCTSTGLTEGKYCAKCNIVLVKQKTIQKLPHQEEIIPGIEATCYSYGQTEGKRCTVCNKRTVFEQRIEKTAHKTIMADGFAPTCTKWGATDVTKCEICDYIIKEPEFLKPIGHIWVEGKCNNCKKTFEDYTNISLYKSNYGYTFFKTATNGKAMTKLYDEMEERLSDFHKNYNRNALYFQEHEKLGSLYLVDEFYYNKYGLKIEEVKTVFSLFRRDHPIFYWMTNSLTWNSKSIKITTTKEFAKGEEREKYNEKIYKEIEEYVKLVDGETSAYNIALTYYETIIEKNSYAKDKEGNPDSSIWSHSVIGGLIYNKFVCEGYAKLFQLLLNFNDIENIYVSGDANGAHGWSIVKMDDGNWYWFDPTWGESNKNKYFCVPNDSFKNHTPWPSNVLGFNAQITLPKASNTVFSSEDILEINEIFRMGDISYKLISSKTVVPLSKRENGPNKIAYNGVVYDILEE